MTTTTLPSSTGAVIEHDREAAGDVPGEGGSAAAGGTAVAQAVAAVGKGNLENLEGWLPASRDDGNWFERSWNSVKDKVNNIPPPPDNIGWNNPDSWTIPVPGVPPVIPVPIP